MKNWKYVLYSLLLFCPLSLHAQAPKGQVEFFCGADLNYADVNFIRLYDLLIYLTPGMKWHPGDDWQLNLQGQIPVINNGYMDHLPGSDRYKMIRLSNATVSKELHFDNARQHFKLSAGLFSRERWGADLRWLVPVNSWLLLQAQAGLTRHYALGFDFHSNYESYIDGKWIATGIAGMNVYLKPWNTEFRLSGGRYINEKLGAQFDVMRHFRHCTVLAYLQVHERGTSYANRHHAGGFKVIMMLPPYKDYANKKVVLRPASNFRLTYNAQSDGVSMKMYTTDPEENERELPVHVAWGTGSNPAGLNNN